MSLSLKNPAVNFSIFNEVLVKEKKVISFSVYGEKSTYLIGAEKNVLEAKKIYPDWVCRFYCPPDLKNLEALKKTGAEVFVVDSKIPPMYWRYFAADDPNVSAVIFRDTDSLVNYREKFAVTEWMSSDKVLHSMHDHASGHWSPIMGGMCGVKTPLSFSMIDGIDKWAKAKRNYTFSYSDDQSFLSQKLLPLYKNSCMDHHHDPSKSKYDYSVPFPQHPPITFGTFVGDRISVFGFVYGEMQVKNSDKVFLMCHQGPKDHFSVRNAIQYAINNHKEVVIPVRSQHINNVKFLFGGYSNVHFIPLDHDNPADQAFDIYLNNYRASHSVIGFGLHSPNPKNLVWGERLCFTQMGVNSIDNCFKINPDPSLVFDQAPNYIKELKVESPSILKSFNPSVSILFQSKLDDPLFEGFSKSLSELDYANIELVSHNGTSKGFFNSLNSSKGSYVLLASYSVHPSKNAISEQLKLIKNTGCEMCCSESFVGNSKQLYNKDLYYSHINSKFERLKSNLLKNGFPDIWNLEFLSHHNSVIDGTMIINKKVLIEHLDPYPPSSYALYLRSLNSSDIAYSNSPLYSFNN